jgi:hypothetical protein
MKEEKKELKLSFSLPQYAPNDTIEIAKIKLECLRISDKHSFNHSDLIANAKKLFGLLNLD